MRGEDSVFLAVDGLTHRFPGVSDPVLRGVSFSIDAGETVLLTGESGSGKTTLLNLIAGLDRPTEGTIEVEGVAVDALGESRRARWRARTVGYVFQHHYLPEGTAAIDAVAAPLLWAKGLHPGRARNAAAAWLERVGMADHAGARVETLSGGQRQRVAIARALATRPPLLLADEPTAQLDRRTAQGIVGLLREGAAETGATLIVVTHELDQQDWGESRRLTLADGRLTREAAAG